jgi:hypothetical protein
MRVSALIAAAVALCALLSPAGYASPAKREPHQRPFVRVARIAPTTLNLAPTQRLPDDTVPVAAANVEANDPSAVDCTYLVCDDATAGVAGEVTATLPLTAAIGVTSVPVAPVSQFCADNSYMC